MIFRKRYLLIILLFLNLSYGRNLFSMQHRLVGGQLVPSFASSYLNIESKSIKVQENASWAYASGFGFFFDYQANPYISFRFDWFFYPGLMNTSTENSGENLSRIKVNEAGFTVKRHFEGNLFNPWFGAGPYMQYTVPNEVDSYVLHILLSFGFDYEISDGVFLCPDFKVGLGIKLISSSEDSVVVELPSGSDFSTSGIVVFMKIGLARSF